MRSIYIIVAISLFAVIASPQSKRITQDEYDIAFEYAISETNSRYPFVFFFTSEIFDNGIVVSKSIHVAERQGPGIERQTFTDIENGKTTKSYQTRTGFGDNVYCSTDGKLWTGPQKYECARSIRVYGPRTPTSVEYSVEEKSISGRKVREYRKFEVYEADGRDSEFDEDLALIGADGLFISTIQTMGDLRSRQVKAKLTNTWKLKAKFSRITVPKNLAAAIKAPAKTTTMTITKISTN